MTDYPHPVIKWAGGKRQLLPEILSLLPPSWNAYHEPFLGGAAMFFELWRTGRLADMPAFLSEVNRELIDVYRAIRANPIGVCESLRAREDQHRTDGEHCFNAVRNLSPWKLSLVDRASRMILLNKTGFNGLYRVNGDGRFNAPWGKVKDKRIYDADNIVAASNALRTAELLCEPFEAVASRAQPGDLVYFDPPYDGECFVGFTAAGFDRRDHDQLAGLFEDLARRGVFVMLSNADTKWVRERYAGQRIVSVQAKRAINCDGDKRGNVGEVIICGWKK